MFRAIFGKEWRQLGLLRWVVIAIAAVLPVAFIAGAEAAKRGIAPFGSLREYATVELFGELLPALVALGLWPLAGLLMGAQVWTGDRAAGTETFLLERPVRRGTTWLARLAAASVSLVAAVAATGAIVAVVATLAGATPRIAYVWLVLAGVGGAALALAAVAGASAFVASPLAACALGLLFAGLPAVLALMLSRRFPHAAVGLVPLGGIVPWLFFGGFVAASEAAFCRGEPAGGGRLRRAFVVLGGTAAIVAVAFCAGAPLAVGYATSPRRGAFEVDASPAGGAAAFARGGWQNMSMSVVDLGSGATVASFAPPTRSLAWHPDGKRLAVFTAAGTFGAEASRMRVEFLETSGRRFAPAVEIDRDDLVGEVWSGERLLVMSIRIEGGASAHARVFEILVIDPATGRTETIPFARGAIQCALAGPTSEGDVYAVVVEDDGRRSHGVVDSTRWRAYRLDASGRPGRAPAAEGSGYPILWSSLLMSPSGRYFAYVRDEGGIKRHALFDAERGEPAATDDVPGWRRGWVAGDGQLAVVRRDDATKLFLVRPGSVSRVLREWPTRRPAIGVEVSPDHRRVLVVARPAAEGTTYDVASAPPSGAWALPSESRGAERETAIFDVESGRWTVLDPAVNPPSPDGKVMWAGPSALVRYAPGFLEVVDLDRPGSRRALFGREPAAAR